MNHAAIRPYFFAAFIVLVAVLTFLLLRPFLVTVALAAVFSVILHPLFGRLKRTLRLPPGGTALVTILISVVVLALPLSFIVTRLFIETQNLYETLSQPGSLAQLEAGIANAARTIDGWLPGSGLQLATLAQDLDAYARQASGWAFGQAANVFSGTLRFVLLTVIFLMTLYYLLKDGPKLRKTIVRLSPLAPAETTLLMERLSRTVTSVVRGNLTIALIQGVLVATGFTIFGIPSGVLWGTIAAFGALVPGIGTSIVVIPGILYLLFTGATGPAIGLAVWSAVIVGLVDNMLSPKLIGGRASIHPLLILLSVLGGIAFFGPEGVFLGPLAISLLIGLLSIYSPASDDTAHAEEAAQPEGT